MATLTQQESTGIMEELKESVDALEARVTVLEAEAARVKSQQATAILEDAIPWWKKIWGTFKDDPDYEEAMRLGREYRESLRPIDDEAVLTSNEEVAA